MSKALAHVRCSLGCQEAQEEVLSHCAGTPCGQGAHPWKSGLHVANTQKSTNFMTLSSGHGSALTRANMHFISLRTNLAGYGAQDNRFRP